MSENPRRFALRFAFALGTSVAAGAGAQSTPGRAFQAGVSVDDLFERVAARSPAFGGLYVDEATSTIHVYSWNRTRTGVADVETAVRGVFGDDLPRGRIVVAPGQYGFRELARWNRRLLALLALPGVVSADVDDRTNRLRVGVEREEVAPGVRDRLAELGVPGEAVDVVERPALRFFTSLRNRHRPLVGGLQILFPSGGSGFLCTLGFNGVRAGIPGFVTASHCTDVAGGVQGTPFFQPGSGSANRVGTESVDPGYFSGSPCPPGRRCRRSDSAFVRRSSGVGGARGPIARPAPGSTAWNDVNKFRVVREAEPLVGQTVTKVGRTTGRSQGHVVEVCVNYGVEGTNIVLLCQAGAIVGSAGGDSGSPVFRITNSPAANDVTLNGILWGGGDDGFMAFSTVGQIQRGSELGSIQTCASGFSC